MNKECLSWSRAAFRQLYGADAESCVSPPQDAWLDSARRHRIAGLRASAPAGPDGWYRLLCGQTLRITRLSAEAGRIYNALQGSVEGLRLVKGPALALQAWPDSGLRDYDDLDFRCDRMSLEPLLAGMKLLGYRPELENPRLRHLWHYGWGITFRNGDRFQIECNHRMFPVHYPWPERLTWRTPEAWQRQMLDGTEILCPGPALHLLLSCVHAVWHGWERLGWMADIAGLLIRHPGCRDEAEKLAQGSPFAIRALQCGCAVAGRIFGPLPGIGSEGGRFDEEIGRALALLSRQSPGISPEIRRDIQRRLMTRREAACSGFRRLATPGDPDFQLVPLPEAMRPLYRLVRPARILFLISFCRRFRSPGKSIAFSKEQ